MADSNPKCQLSDEFLQKMRSLSEDAKIIGYPTIAVDSLPTEMIETLEDICSSYFEKR